MRLLPHEPPPPPLGVDNPALYGGDDLSENTFQRSGMSHRHKHHHCDCGEHEHSHSHDQDHPHDLGHCHAPGPERHAHARTHGGVTQAGGRVLTVRAVAGLSGDMILAGLARMAELTSDELEVLVAELRLPALTNSLRLEERAVNAVQGWGCRIELPHEHVHRTLADIEGIIAASDMPADAKEFSGRVFCILAEAEAAVHGASPAEIAFHEVGALDSILDTCLACRIFTLIKPDRFVCSPLPLADGTIRCAHGLMPSPAPAVLRLLEGVPVRGFAGEGETVTPTALSLLKALGAEFGPWPEMRVQKTAISYGTKVFSNAPNGAVWSLGRR